MALCVSAGIEFFGKPVDPSPVIYIEEEGDPSMLQSRIKSQATWLGLLDRLVSGDLPLTIYHRQRFRLDDPEKVAALRDDAVAMGAKSIIMGPLSQIAAIKDETALPRSTRSCGLSTTSRPTSAGLSSSFITVERTVRTGPPKTVEAFAASVRQLGLHGRSGRGHRHCARPGGLERPPVRAAEGRHGPQGAPGVRFHRWPFIPSRLPSAARHRRRTCSPICAITRGRISKQRASAFA